MVVSGIGDHEIGYIQSFPRNLQRNVIQGDDLVLEVVGMDMGVTRVPLLLVQREMVIELHFEHSRLPGLNVHRFSDRHEFESAYRLNSRLPLGQEDLEALLRVKEKFASPAA